MMMMSDFRPDEEIWPFCTWRMKKICNNPYLWMNRQNSRVLNRKSGSRKSMATSDFRLKYKYAIACTMKSMDCNPYWWTNG